MVGFYLLYGLVIVLLIAFFVTQVFWPIVAGIPLFWAFSKTGRAIRKELKSQEDAELNEQLNKIRKTKR